jgi:hypothetical protein
LNGEESRWWQLGACKAPMRAGVYAPAGSTPFLSAKLLKDQDRALSLYFRGLFQ